MIDLAACCFQRHGQSLKSAPLGSAGYSFQHHGQRHEVARLSVLVAVFSTMDRSPRWRTRVSRFSISAPWTVTSSFPTLWTCLFSPAILTAQPAQFAVRPTLMRPTQPVNLSGNIIKAVQQRVQILCLFTQTKTRQEGIEALVSYSCHFVCT